MPVNQTSSYVRLLTFELDVVDVVVGHHVVRCLDTTWSAAIALMEQSLNAAADAVRDGDRIHRC